MKKNTDKKSLVSFNVCISGINEFHMSSSQQLNAVS